MGQHVMSAPDRETSQQTLVDKLAVVVLLGLAAAGGLSVLGLVYAGLATVGHVL
ncbi:hypothetical protein [Sulfobacillus sp. hq2]|uniref:hypothetical protein n=1 Tax=Sulfobacillus TaxID=28033 RepID=UPI001304B4B4|nr:hypothetical protein [Sulfobacillus sp. hq2]